VQKQKEQVLFGPSERGEPGWVRMNSTSAESEVI
jgi:hypothetical protein